MNKNIQSQKKQNLLQKIAGKVSVMKLSLVMALASLMSLSAFAADGDSGHNGLPALPRFLVL